MYIYYFPRIIRSNFISIQFIQNFYSFVKKNHIKNIVLNFESTVQFETNLLALFSYILEDLEKSGVAIVLKLKKYHIIYIMNKL